MTLHCGAAARMSALFLGMAPSLFLRYPSVVAAKGLRATASVAASF
jgi:hypothetical protein